MNTAVNIKPSAEFNKLQKRLRKATGEAVVDFNMIEEGDRIMVCLSGGADSYTMLDMLLNLKRVAPVNFSLIAVNLDQKQPGFPEHVLPEYLEKLGVEYKILEEDTYSIVIDKVPEGKTTCALCSRLRRGILYNAAQEMGATKIALGHHREDILETLLLNMFYAGSLKTMPPKLVSDDGKNIVIRPLAYCKEADIKAYSQAEEYPIIPCNLCGSQPNLQRQAMKALLGEWEKENPGRLASMMTALGNTSPSHLLDRRYYDFTGISTQDGPVKDGDTLFDSEPLPNQGSSVSSVIPIFKA
ncbi:tRNA 2-thiocytidine(32) synthetase TtcA [Leucothrix arctica]|uniref:tRNA-cytidine(32) 2-sulfurtransferase n=1 Tax=Leucothrix arctica TaxID=1481894 RepID=A0A317C4B3_9GAMM|nr:tRNA 2-thiocytidine(32) synthetase TtcA [Leucothrix arctica]PWQ93119.1 tRNA 2-thiocytidine(32) synthetase TtcA [Leucothrix arctica]